jgi:hypothetical protein
MIPYKSMTTFLSKGVEKYLHPELIQKKRPETVEEYNEKVRIRLEKKHKEQGIE